MSFNLRISTANDANYAWDNRREAVVTSINDLNPDILSVQEASIAQDSFLVARLTHYIRVPSLDTISHSTQIVNGIFYRNDRFALLTAKYFWLSPTPNVPSVGWGAAYPRVANYALLQNINSHDRIMILNTHLDHISAYARSQELHMIADTITAHTHDSIPIFVTGDMNMSPSDTVLNIIRRIMISTADTMHNTNPTYHDWGQLNNGGEQIDYVFYRHANPLSYRVVHNAYGAKYLSDHYPILTTFR